MKHLFSKPMLLMTTFISASLSMSAFTFGDGINTLTRQIDDKMGNVSNTTTRLMATADDAYCNVYVDDITITPGETLAVPVNFANNAVFNAFQVWFELPDGLTLETLELGERMKGMKYYDEEGMLCSANATLSIAKDNSTCLGVAPIANEYDADGNRYGAVKWTAGDGEMFVMYLKASEDFEGGVVTMPYDISSGVDTRQTMGNMYKGSTQVTVAIASSLLVGDVNQDGAITISDVTILIDRVLNGSSIDGCYDACADVDGDGNINISDVTALIDLVLAN